MQTKSRIGPVKRLLIVLTLLMLAIGITAGPASATSSGGYVHITSGHGTVASPYHWHLSKNHTSMVIENTRRVYATSEGYHAVIGMQLLVSNWTTTHWDGDNTKTRYYWRYTYYCTTTSLDVTAPCQHMGFTPVFDLGNTPEYVHARVACDGVCSQSWPYSASLSHTQYLTGGIYSDTYKMWSFNWGLRNIWIKVHNHVIHVAGSNLARFQAYITT